MKIEVYKKCEKHYIPHSGKFLFENEEECPDCKMIETIDRKPFNKGWFGNFVPYWCRYKRKLYLIHGSIDYSYMHGYALDAYIVIE